MDKPDPRLAALTGEALTLLVEAGATAEVVGHFAIHYPAKAAAKLEPLPPPAPEIDLEAVIRAAVQAALGGGLAGGLATERGAENPLTPATSTNARRGQRDVARVKLNVNVQGKRTSVKLRTGLYEQLSNLEGSPKVEELVQSFVDKVPDGHVNRSAWVEEQAMQFLVLSELRPPATAAGH